MYICVGDDIIDANRILMILDYAQICENMPKLADEAEKNRKIAHEDIKSVILMCDENEDERILLSNLSVRTLTGRVSRAGTVKGAINGK